MNDDQNNNPPLRPNWNQSVANTTAANDNQINSPNGDQNDSRLLSLFDVLLEEYERQVKTHGLKPLYLDDTTNPDAITGKLKLTKELRELAEVLPKTDERREPLLQSAEEFCISAQEKRNQVKNEFENLADEKEREKRIEEELVKDFFQRLHRSDVKRAALCFSGGGIRSATFVLGLLQGLAQNGLELDRFHYVSTVSGGGYIGSWLSAWIHRQGMKRVQADLSRSKLGSRGEQDEEKAGVKISPLDPEPEPIQHLRRYSNYLSPKLGLFSADTWTLAGTFLRNLSLHWLVLIPLMIAALAVPRLAVSIASYNYPKAWAETLLILGGFIFGIISVTYLIGNLPSLSAEKSLKKKLGSESKFLWWGWLPMIASAFFCSAFWSWIHIHYGSDFKFFGFRHDRPLPFVAFGFLINMVAYLAALFIYKSKTGWVDLLIRVLTGMLGGVCLWAMTLAFALPVKIIQKENQPGQQAEQAQAIPTPQPAPAGSATIASPSLPVKIEIAVMQQPALQETQKGAEEIKAVSFQAGLYTCLAPSLFLLAFLIAATVFIGLASGHNNDADREWMARAGGWMLIAIFGWSVTSGLVIFGPVGLLWLWREFQVSLISVGAGSGLLTLLGGFSAKTSAGKKDDAAKSTAGMAAGLLSRSLPLAAMVFTAIILAALSLMTSSLIAVAYAS